MGKSNPTLVFVHVPKTAGTTLLEILNNNYTNVFQTDGVNPKRTKDEFEDYSIVKQNEFDAIIGHLTLGLSNKIENPILLTYLRNPVDHFISLFHYIKRAKSNRLHQSVKHMDDILDFIEYAKERGEDNLQTRHLSNAVEHLTDQLKEPNNMSIDGDLLLQKAKQNLMKFDYVFHTSQFDKSLIILKNDLGWNNSPYYSIKNKTVNRPLRSSIDPTILEKIKELNKYDVELFEYSKPINNMLIDKYNIEDELVKFNRSNRIYQKVNRLKAKFLYYPKKVINRK